MPESTKLFAHTLCYTYGFSLAHIQLSTTIETIIENDHGGRKNIRYYWDYLTFGLILDTENLTLVSINLPNLISEF